MSGDSASAETIYNCGGDLRLLCETRSPLPLLLLLQLLHC